MTPIQAALERYIAAERRFFVRFNRPVTDFVARLPIRLEFKLVVAFIAVVALLVLLGAAGLAVLAQTSRRTESLIEAEQRIDTFHQLAHDSHMTMIAVSSALWLPAAGSEDAARKLADFRTKLGELRPQSSREAALIAEFHGAADNFGAIAERELGLLRAGNVDQAGAVQSDQLQPASHKLDEASERLIDAAEAAMAEQIVVTRDTYRNARNRMFAFVIAAALFGFYLAHTIATFVVGPVHAIGGRLSQIAGGEFARRIEVPNRDEIGALADSVNRTSEQLGELYTALETEKERSEEILYQVLPRRIIARMNAGESLIADRVAGATILFSDLAGFTELSDHLAPEEVVDVLDVLFSRFDSLVDRLGLEKIKTIGDGYMVAAGVLEPRPDHAAAMAEMALAMRAATDIATRALGVIGRPLQLRIGLNSGPLVAGVLGTNKLVYDVWGDTVNTASRMEKYGESGRIHVSAATRALLGNQFRFEPREPIEVKGKGTMETFFLERHIGPRHFHNIVRRGDG